MRKYTNINYGTSVGCGNFTLFHIILLNDAECVVTMCLVTLILKLGKAVLILRLIMHAACQLCLNSVPRMHLATPSRAEVAQSSF